MRLQLIAASILLSLSSTAVAQSAIEYRVQPSALWYQSDNPFFLYWVTGPDSVGNRYRNVSVEKHEWTTADRALLNTITQHMLDVSRRVVKDTFVVSPVGQVLGIRGDNSGPEGRIDLLMPLPSDAPALPVGFTWKDSLRQEYSGAYGPGHYGIKRTLRVARHEQRAGSTIAHVSSEGTVWFRLSFATDSAAGKYMWSESTGPVSETFEFDIGQGRMAARTWSMDLRGSGALPNDRGGMDTVPAGLVSRQFMRLIEESTAAQLGRELPGTDTTITVNANGIALLHVAGVAQNERTAAMVRNDGTVGTAQAAYEGPKSRKVTIMWTSPDFEPRRISIEAYDTIVIADDQKIPIPSSLHRYAVADHGMDELLVPMLRSLPVDGSEQRIGVLRPFTGKWEVATAVQHDMGAFVLIGLSYEGSASPVYLIMAKEGDLVYVEQPGESQRLPRPTDPRRSTLEAFLRQLQSAPASNQ